VSETHYLVDTNALSRLTASERASRFVRARCGITDDVLWESRDLADAANLQILVQPMTAHALALIKEIMRTVPVEDLKLVNLYGNKGAADPGLIACALAATARSQDTLFQQEWLVVTDDGEVRSKAERFDVEWMSSSDFVATLRATP
jgi:predicted nucleic acid-binding protein